MHRILIMIALSCVLAGCISGSMERQTDGAIEVKYRSLFKNITAPSVEIEKDGEYSAKVNAESSVPTLTAEEAAAILKLLGVAK